MPRRILVVDDDPQIRNVLQRFLREEDYDVRAIDDGDQVLDSLREAPADLVLLDLDMPRLNGLEVLRRIMAGGIEVDVIVVSGHFDERAFEIALDLGARGHLRKPVDLDTLQATLEQYFTGR